MAQPLLDLPLAAPANLPFGNVSASVQLPVYAQLVPIFLNYSTENIHKTVTLSQFLTKHAAAHLTSPEFGASNNPELTGGPSVLSKVPMTFQAQKTLGETAYGVSFKGIDEETAVVADLRSTVIGHLELDPNEDLGERLLPGARKGLKAIDRTCSKHNVTGEVVRLQVSEFYRRYGEFVTTSLFLGNYILDMQSTQNIKLDSADQTRRTTESQKGDAVRVGPVSVAGHAEETTETEMLAPMAAVTVSGHGSRSEYGKPSDPEFFMKDIMPTSMGSSFVPIYSIIMFDYPYAARALKHWIHLWNAKPRNLGEYLAVNHLSSVENGTVLELWTGNFPYQVVVNEDNQLQLKDSRVIERYRRLHKWNIVAESEDVKPLFINPDDLSIYGFDATRAFQTVEKPKDRGFLVWEREIHVHINALWAFRDPTVLPHFTCSVPGLLHMTETPNSFSLFVWGQSLSGRKFTREAHGLMHGRIHIKPPLMRSLDP